LSEKLGRKKAYVGPLFRKTGPPGAQGISEKKDQKKPGGKMPGEKRVFIKKEEGKNWANEKQDPGGGRASSYSNNCSVRSKQGTEEVFSKGKKGKKREGTAERKSLVEKGTKKNTKCDETNPPKKTKRTAKKKFRVEDRSSQKKKDHRR